ncbi:hypothetical protein [Lactobacillus crispatus]|uniref:hypothetical protein n=1 Tax=Lactobacillus crispatus TaxID=47770 RepID=UPI0012D92D00|nr:hypothetical protein [Lactobacillus crispatus]MCT7870313.1 hypothetical protein [Lactobacillus crispatus]QGS05651.1 hypothetical protein FOC51_06165 [Lactobacillus crispatus]
MSFIKFAKKASSGNYLQKGERYMQFYFKSSKRSWKLVIKPSVMLTIIAFVLHQI